MFNLKNRNYLHKIKCVVFVVVLCNKWIKKYDFSVKILLHVLQISKNR